MDDTITTLVAGLMASSCFEDAATITLQALLGCVAGCAAALAPAGTRPLRGVVHVRPNGGYQRLFGIEHGSCARTDGPGYLTSANVWRWIFEHRCAVSIDVQRGTIRPWLRDGPIERREADIATGLPSHDTREHMLGRDANHVHVVPLRAPGGDVDGMITIEVSNKSATGPDALWEACHEDLEILGSIARGYLLDLPSRPAVGSHTDELLPVVGPTTAGVIELLRVFARQEETILISGPTGSGKSRLARWCHVQSPHGVHPFETVDLVSVPEELQMAELFGWRRGAFTGAVKDAPGAIARAGGGSLFIDEIDKLSLKAQAGLLRVLEERRYRPLGDAANERRAEARFLVGTNVDLRASVRAGRFREDLYYRINVLPVRLPPLCERSDELPLWADYMLRRRHRESGESVARIAADAMDRLLGAQWPGNLRQLDNIVRRSYALALAERGGVGGVLILEGRHVERALAYDGVAASESLVTLLWRAARDFVREAERRAGMDTPLVLDHCDALRGLVLAAAVGKGHSREEAFVLLGQAPLLKNRNHHRALRRELDRVREFVRATGQEPEGELAAALAAADEPTGGT